jgi:membrane protease subunit (stomatin/prohibitin family)
MMEDLIIRVIEFCEVALFLGGNYGMHKLINLDSGVNIMGLLGAAVVGGMVGRRSARRQMESMQRQAQQAQQIQQVQAQAAQVQAQPQQTPGSAKSDPMQEIARLGELKQKGLLTEEEFQKMKANLIAKM